MSVVTAIEEEALNEALASIRQVLRAERARTEIERDAFEEFGTRIADLQPSSRPSAGDSEHGGFQEMGGAITLQHEPGSGTCATDNLATIRHAYEETVMSVSFYEAEYGDSYEESIHGEFGPDVGTALTESDYFSSAAK